MSYPFIGGFGKLEMAPSPVADFDADPAPEGLVELDEEAYIPDGSSMPEVDPQSAEVGNGQQGPVGENVPFELRFNGVDATEIDTVKNDGYQLIPYDVRITSEDGRTEVTMRRVILTVATNALNDANEYGYVAISGTGRNQPAGVEPRYEVDRIDPAV